MMEDLKIARAIIVGVVLCVLIVVAGCNGCQYLAEKGATDRSKITGKRQVPITLGTEAHNRTREVRDNAEHKD